jgi:hypothetical protein
MVFTYDPTTTLGKTRKYAQDTGTRDTLGNTVINTANAIFTDTEIQSFLDANSQNVFLAAADALEVTAANQAYVLKNITNNGLQTNGAATAAALQATAKIWREKGLSSDGTTTVSCGVEIVPNADDPYLDLR